MVWLLIKTSLKTQWTTIRRRGEGTGLVVSGILIAILAAIAVGEYLFFSQFLTTLGRSAYFAAPLLFYIAEIFFAVLMLLVFLSSIITAAYLLFRSTTVDLLVVAPVSPKVIARSRFVELLFLSSWVVVVLGLPLLIVFAQFHGIGIVGGLLMVLGLLLFLVMTASAGLLAAFGVQALARHAGNSLLLLVSLGVVIGGGVALARSLVPIDLGDFFEAANLGLPVAPTERIAELFQWWPSAGVGLLFHSVAEGLAAETAWSLAFLGGAAAAMSIVALWVAQRYHISLWRFSREGSFIAETTSAKKTVPISRPLPFVFFGAAGALVEKELRRFWRSQESISRALFLVFLMVLYGVMLSRLSLEETLGGSRFFLVVSMVFAVVLYLASTLILQFVFPLLPRERKRGWRIAISTTPRRLLFVVYALFGSISIALLAGGGLLFSGLLLGLSPRMIALMVWLGVEGVVAIAVVALAVGARARLLAGDDAERIATTGPGLLVAGISVFLSAFLAWGLFRGFSSETVELSVAGMSVVLVFVIVAAVRIGHRATARMEFQTGETVA